jgi:Ca2+/Na+ antiporter
MATNIVKQGLLKRIAPVLWIVGIIILFGYGLLAMNSGLKLSESYGNDKANEVAVIVRDQADRNESNGQEMATQILPLWMNIAAKSGTEKFVFGSDSAMDAYIHYFQMNNTDKFVLSSHMMLGMMIMTFGALQFWPAFRKRYPKTHRYTGMIYLTAAFSSMGLSIHHLIETGPDKTYGSFTFFIGLWILAIGSIGALIAAIYYIKKKDIMRHMGWQALAFCFFMTAPLQRVNWIILPYFFAGHTSFNEMNYLVNVVLLIEAVLMGYVLFYANRSSISKQANTAMTSPSEMHKPLRSLLGGVVATAAAIACVLFIAYFVVSPGFSNHAATISLFPSSLITADQAIHVDRTLDIL